VNGECLVPLGYAVTADEWAKILLSMTEDDRFLYFNRYFAQERRYTATTLMVRVKTYIRRRSTRDKAFLQSLVERVVDLHPQRVRTLLNLAVTFAIPDLVSALLRWAPPDVLYAERGNIAVPEVECMVCRFEALMYVARHKWFRCEMVMDRFD
jgi:hypothetical protein